MHTLLFYFKYVGLHSILNFTDFIHFEEYWFYFCGSETLWFVSHEDRRAV